MTEREALIDLLEAVDLAIYSGDWKVDGACDPDAAIQRARDVLAQPEQKPVAHSVVAGALFDFMGWLTSRNKRLTLSGADEASPAVEAIQEFSEKRGLSLKHAEVGFWTEFLSTPPQRKPLTDEQKLALCKQFPDHLTFNAIHAIEAAHQIYEDKK